MRNFKKVFVSALVTGIALAASADVMAQRGPGRDGRDISRDDFRGDRRFNNGHRNRGGGYSVESEFIGRTFYPGERLLLGRELGLRQHRGKEVEKVELEMQTSEIITILNDRIKYGIKKVPKLAKRFAKK